MIMKSTKDPKEVVVEESSGRVFEEGVTGRSRDKERYRDLADERQHSGTGCRHLASKSEVDRDGEAAWRHTTEKEEESPR